MILPSPLIIGPSPSDHRSLNPSSPGHSPSSPPLFSTTEPSSSLYSLHPNQDRHSGEHRNKHKGKKKNKANPFSVDNVKDPVGNLVVLKDPIGCDIDSHYDLGNELSRCEFRATYPCIDHASDDHFACKSILKNKLRTSVNIEDVQRDVEIMRLLPPHPNIVSLKDTFEDDDAVHLVMELYEGGEFFDRIVARGHYTERAVAVVTRTIVFFKPDTSLMEAREKLTSSRS